MIDQRDKEEEAQTFKARGVPSGRFGAGHNHGHPVAQEISLAQENQESPIPDQDGGETEVSAGAEPALAENVGADTTSAGTIKLVAEPQDLISAATAAFNLPAVATGGDVGTNSTLKFAERCAPKLREFEVALKSLATTEADHKSGKKRLFGTMMQTACEFADMRDSDPRGFEEWATQRGAKANKSLNPDHRLVKALAPRESAAQISLFSKVVWALRHLGIAPVGVPNALDKMTKKALQAVYNENGPGEPKVSKLSSGPAKTENHEAEAGNVEHLSSDITAKAIKNLNDLGDLEVTSDGRPVQFVRFECRGSKLSLAFESGEA